MGQAVSLHSTAEEVRLYQVQAAPPRRLAGEDLCSIENTH